MPEGDEDDEDDKIEFGYSNFDGEQFHTRTSADYRHLLEEPAPVNSRSVDEPAPIPLDTARIETIKSIMSNITLPSSAVPNWANTVSDDGLKQVVDEKLSKKTADKEDWAKFDWYQLFIIVSDSSKELSVCEFVGGNKPGVRQKYTVVESASIRAKVSLWNIKPMWVIGVESFR